MTSNYVKHTKSSAAQGALIEQFYRSMFALIKQLDIHSVLDAGCGEGFTLERLKKSGIGKKLVGFDASEEAIRLGRKLFPGQAISLGDIYAISHKDKSFDLVICSEVLEHLERPSLALSELARVSRQYILLTVPWEPWFQTANFIRGKYLSGWGNHPEHINHWTHGGFLRLVRDSGLVIVASRISFPWTIVLTRRP